MGATAWAARSWVCGSELGQVQPGFLADLLLVDGNPLDDLRMLEDRGPAVAIMKDGIFHKRPPPAPISAGMYDMDYGMTGGARRSSAPPARALARDARWRSHRRA